MVIKKVISYAILLFTLVFCNVALAQSPEAIPDKELIEMVKKASESGMSQDQIEALAATKGYSPSDIVRIKSRIIGIKGKTKQLSSDSTETDNDSTFVNKKRKKKYADLSPEEQKKMELRDKIYGLSFFNKELANFQPNLKIPIPKNYIIGTDDELSIDISGYAFAHYSAKVSPAGTIKIENLSPIFVSGQTVEQAKEKIIQRLRTLFGSLSNSGSLTADITLSKIRSIQVNVIGEAVFPGSYTISSVATAFNLLYEAGGPTEIGSLRNIEIFRNGKVYKKLDVYDYLLGGDLRDNVILQDQDILRIPYVEDHVILNGNVRNPKTFEIQRGETLQKVISYAGGFNELAYSKSVRVDRNTDIGKKIVSVDFSGFNSFTLQKGDLIFIDSLNSRKFNEVIIKGGVYKPGSYSIETAPSLSKLIALSEGLKPEAFIERILIKRKNNLFEDEILDINYKEYLLNGKDDFQLKIYDSVIVSLRSELKELKTIQIDGEVNKPQALEYSDNLTVSKALLLAGGIREGANVNKIEIARRVRKDGVLEEKTVEIVPIKIHPDLLSSNLDNGFILMPFDRIYVRKMSQYEVQKSVTITGEVMYPGPYTLEDRKVRITDLIDKAGGLKTQANISGAKFTRKGEEVGVNLTEIIKNNDSNQNLLLISGDGLDIPIRKETVKVSGNVFSEVIIPFEPQLSVSDYISLAGGMNDSAYAKKIYLKYGNGRFAKTTTFLGVKKYPKVENGSEIIVPNRVRQRLSKAEIFSISSAMVSLSAVILTLIRIIPSSTP
jgi:polysaccharide biosynthesis/export protein